MVVISTRTVADTRPRTKPRQILGFCETESMVSPKRDLRGTCQQDGSRREKSRGEILFHAPIMVASLFARCSQRCIPTYCAYLYRNATNATMTGNQFLSETAHIRTFYQV